MSHKITKLYAFISIDNKDGDEGIIAFSLPDGTMMPMIGSDMTRVESLKTIADKMDVEYKIKYFTLES